MQYQVSAVVLSALTMVVGIRRTNHCLEARKKDKMRTVEGILGIVTVIIPIVVLLWSLVDLNNPPSTEKAPFKIVVGVAVTLFFVPLNLSVWRTGSFVPLNSSVWWTGLFFMGVGIVIALLGTADLAAARTTQSKK
jgi:hypothetical protein